MAILVTCKRCGTQIKARDKHVGRRVKCPVCGHALVITGRDRRPGHKPGTSGDSETTPPKNAPASPTGSGGAEIIPEDITLVPDDPETKPPAEQDVVPDAWKDVATSSEDIPLTPVEPKPAPPEPVPVSVDDDHEADEAEQPVPPTEEPPDVGPEVWTECPACGRSLTPGTALCPACGYDKKTRRRMRLGAWWDQPTVIGWRVSAVLITLVALHFCLVTLPAARGGTPGVRMVIYLIKWFAPAILIATVAGVWLRFDHARLAWLVLLIADNLIEMTFWPNTSLALGRAMLWFAPSLANATGAWLLGAARLTWLGAWVVGWSLMTGQHATRKLVVIGAAIVVASPAVVHLVAYLIRATVRLVGG